jgi:hypothetical protein
MYPVNTHSKPYVNGAQNAHVSTGAVAIAPAGGTEARAGVCEAIWNYESCLRGEVNISVKDTTGFNPPTRTGRRETVSKGRRDDRETDAVKRARAGKSRAGRSVECPQ